MLRIQVAPAPSLEAALQSFQTGRLDDAIETCLALMRITPGHFDAIRLLAVTLGRLGRHADALPFFEAIAEARPADAEAQMNLGATLFELRRYHEALETSDRAIAIQPDLVDACFNRGHILRALDRLEEAAACFAHVTALKPDHFGALSHRARILFALGRYDESVACFDGALKIAPDSANDWAARGDALYEIGRFGDALESYDAALAIDPTLALALVRRANILYFDSRFDEALSAYDRALALAPDLTVARANRANTLKELGRFADAMVDLEVVLARNPADDVARFNRAHLLLLLGRLREGLADYEVRKTVQNRSARRFADAEWSRPAEGQTVLVHTEQGLGDTIQFARFASRLAAEGVAVLLETQPEIARLMRTLRGVTDGEVRIVKRGEATPPFSDHIQIMSLPRALGTTMSDLAEPAYLSAEADRVAAWSGRLPRQGLRIGIAWQGSTHPLTDRGRSMPLSVLAPLAAHEDAVFVSLQKNAGAEQVATCAFRHRIVTLGSDFDAGSDAFLDCAAVMANLDLVVTSDTAIAHLAGALGRPVWIALQHVPNWRWFLDRADCPWYPTARLFRQDRRGDWTSVFEAMRAALPGFVAGQNTA